MKFPVSISDPTFDMWMLEFWRNVQFMDRSSRHYTVSIEEYGARLEYDDNSSYIQAAIDDVAATASALRRGIVFIPPGNWNCGSTKVTLKQYVDLFGISRFTSQLTFSGTGVSFGTGTTGGHSSIRDLYIYNSAVTGIALNLSELDGSSTGPNYCNVYNCFVQGGQYSVKLDNCVGACFMFVDFGNNPAHASGNDLYPFYVSATSYVNTTSFFGCRMSGRLYYDAGTNGTTLTYLGGTIESNKEPVIQLFNTKGAFFAGVHCESADTLGIIFDIASTCYGGKVTCCDIKGSSSTNHIDCDGTSWSFENNAHHNISTTPQYDLESNSYRCRIYGNWDAGGSPFLPQTTDSGTRNQVEPTGDIIYHKDADADTSGTGETTLTTDTIMSLTEKQGISIEVWGVILNANGTKTIKLVWGGTSITVLNAVNCRGVWKLQAKIRNNSATNAQVISWELVVDDLVGGTRLFYSDNTSSTQNTTGNVTVAIKAQCANASDTVRLKQQTIVGI